MATTAIDKQRIDAHDWLRNLGLDPYLLGTLKSMAAGEKLWLGAMTAPTGGKADIGLISASIARTQSGFEFDAVWNAQLDGKDRPNLWVEGLFCLVDKEIIFETAADVAAMRTFQTVARRIRWIVRHHDAYGQCQVVDQDWLIHTLWHCQITHANRKTRFGCLGPDAGYALRMVFRPGSRIRHIPSQERIAA